MIQPKVAVIPVAGRGTRWMPVSRSVPKELLPVWRRTSASYAFEEAVMAGLDEIIFVVSPEKYEVVEHFQRFDASDLGEKIDGQAWKSLHERVRIRACIQEEPLGLGHAVLCAEKEVDGRPFAVLLPDEVLVENGIQRLLSHIPSVLLMEVGFEERSNYGIVRVVESEKGLLVEDLVEKPRPSAAPSSLAVTGRYVFTPEIFDFLHMQKPGHGGEIQLTDAMRGYTRHFPICGVVYDGIRYDVGQPLGLLSASLDYALRDKEMSSDVVAMMRHFLERES